MPIINYNESLACSPYRFFPSLLGQCIFGDVSKTLGPRDPKPRDRWKFKKKSLLTYKMSNTFMRLPNRVIQSRNLEPNFPQSRNPDSYFRNPVSPHLFQSRISPSFCFKIPNLELQIREIPHPGKPISDSFWYNFIVHVLKHGKTIILNSNFSDVSFTPIWYQQLGFFGINIQRFLHSVLRFHFFRGNRYLMFWRKFAIGKIFVALQTTWPQLLKRCIMLGRGGGGGLRIWKGGGYSSSRLGV